MDGRTRLQTWDRAWRWVIPGMQAALSTNSLLIDYPQNVHEGPIGIGTRVQLAEVQLSAGNVLSDGECWSCTRQSPLTLQNRVTMKMGILESV